MQEALLAAAVQWPAEGVPASPDGWLITVAARRMADVARSELARRRREAAVAAWEVPGQRPGAPADAYPVAPDAALLPGDGSGGDDTLTLLFLCCHPALSDASRVALTLRAVAGLTTAQIARAFLVPEPTMAQRISRAKQRIKAAGARFELPPRPERDERLRAVSHVLYLIFTEGHTATFGADLQRPDLTGEAIRLARGLHRWLPDDGEAAGLLALMLLTDARRAARTGPGGRLVPLEEQDRTRWDRERIAEGIALISDTLTRAPIGPYQLQAAIAAVHAEATTAEATDWAQILVLYRMLLDLAPSPMARLNHVVALAMVHGPRAGLHRLESLAADQRLAGHHRLYAVRAHLLERAGDSAAARATYREAARRATSIPEQNYLYERAARLDPPESDAGGGVQPVDPPRR